MLSPKSLLQTRHCIIINYILYPATSLCLFFLIGLKPTVIRECCTSIFASLPLPEWDQHRVDRSSCRSWVISASAHCASTDLRSGADWGTCDGTRSAPRCSCASHRWGSASSAGRSWVQPVGFIGLWRTAIDLAPMGEAFITQPSWRSHHLSGANSVFAATRMRAQSVPGLGSGEHWLLKATLPEPSSPGPSRRCGVARTVRPTRFSTASPLQHR